MYTFGVIIILFYINGCYSYCNWTIKEMPANSPLYIKNNNKLYVPKSTSIELDVNQNIDLVCSSRNNRHNNIMGTQKSWGRMKCIRDKNVALDGIAMIIKNITCEKNPSASLKTNVGDTFSIGFETPNGRSELFEIKYDNVHKTVVYVNHTIHGKALISFNDVDIHSDFKSDGLDPRIAWNEILNKDRTKERLNYLIGEKRTQQYYLKTFLARGHLAAKADFIFPSWQKATYFIANTVPQWQTINAGCWLQMERAVRAKADNIKDDLKVYTGVHGVLTLKNAFNFDTEIYLYNDNQIPVPKYIWKVVCDKNDNCIAFVVLNDPLTAISNNVCPDICTRTGWSKSVYAIEGKSILICCDVNVLKRIFPNIPRINVNRNLTNTVNIPRNLPHPKRHRTELHSRIY